jgi:hypothetical protein
VSERKRRAYKDRHEFAWNPDFGWQILRRCSNYQKAVEIFIKAAKRAGDKDSLDAFKVVSLDEAKRRPFTSFAYQRARRGTKDRMTLLRDQDVASNFPLIPTFKGRRFDSEPRRYYKIDTSTKHYQRFYEWYGDLLLFPINPESAKPRIEGLSSLWALYSIRVRDMNSDLNMPISTENGNIINLSLTINRTCPGDR